MAGQEVRVDARIPQGVGREVEKEEPGVALLSNALREQPGGDGLLLFETAGTDGLVSDAGLAVLVRLEDRRHQVFLVLEVRVHGPLGEAGGVGHFVERRGGEPLFGEDPGRGLDEALPGLGLLLFAGQSLAGAHAPFCVAGGTGVRSSSIMRWNRS